MVDSTHAYPSDTPGIDLDAIQARAETASRVFAKDDVAGVDYDAAVTVCGRDVPALVVEVRRLREKRDLLAEAVAKLAAVRKAAEGWKQRTAAIYAPEAADHITRILDDHTETGDQKRYTLTIRNTAACGCVLDGGLNLIEACDDHTEAGNAGDAG